MRMRRGTDFWPGQLGTMVHQYAPGDIVVSNVVAERSFTGIVRQVQPKLNKVLVAWGGGSVVQHDPDEIMLLPAELLERRLTASEPRRVKKAEDASPFPISEFVTSFLGVYSQFYLFHWQTRGFAQHLAFEGANEDLSGLMDAFVEGWQGKYGRVSVGTQAGLFNYGEEDEAAFVEAYRDFVAGTKDLLGDEDDDLANIIDEMVARLNKLSYLLTLE